jgi:hypothetical protein
LITVDANVRCTVSLDCVHLILTIVCGDSDEPWQWSFETSLFLGRMLLGTCHDSLAS